MYLVRFDHPAVFITALSLSRLIADATQAFISPFGDKSDQFEAPEPYLFLHDDCSDCLPPQPLSPDPFVRTTWDEAYTKKLQLYRVERPEKFSLEPPDAIDGLESWINNGGDSILVVKKSAKLRLDWGTERAAWLEFLSDELNYFPNTTVQASLSEFNSPYPGKTHPVTGYGLNTFRLETNDELYDGIRFTWLYFDLPPQSTFTISNVSLVAKIKPVSYRGSFASSNQNLTRIWYTGAYAVRLNMEENGFNSILLERGDRVAIQGDGHPTMATALVAFQSYHLVYQMLNDTNSGHVHGHPVVDDSIMPYPIYWTISVYNWYMASGETEQFLEFVPDIMSILDLRITDFLRPNLDIGWAGWDDRLGNGWCFHYNNDECPREGHLTFAALVIRACRDFARALEMAGHKLESQKYHQVVKDLSKRFRQIPEWPHGLGVHSATNAINADLATKGEIDEWMRSLLNDSVSICSWSPFNQYWILQGFGNADKMEHALASIHLCWGSMLQITKKGCFYELYSPEWNSFRGDGDLLPTMPSYCHPWSSGVSEWMSHALAGIEPLLPGFRRFVATPYVSSTYPFVEAKMPTPVGPIQLNATMEVYDGKGVAIITLNFNAPVDGFVGFRAALSKTCSLQDVNEDGKTLSLMTQSQNVLLEQHFLSVKGSALRFVQISKANIHTIRAVYTGGCASSNSSPIEQQVSQTVKPVSSIPHFPPFPEPHYRGSVEIDRKSRGDGLHHHGQDGFMLFGVGSNQSDAVQLPNYISSVNIQDHGYYGWLNLSRTFIGNSNSDPSFLPMNKSRSLGMIGHGDDTYWNPGFLIDFRVNQDSYPDQDSILLDIHKKVKATDDLYFSLYCVARSKGENFAVRVMDLESLDVVAPTLMISDYEGGVWFTVRYNQSLRLRVMGIYGVHISALGFSRPATGESSDFLLRG